MKMSLLNVFCSIVWIPRREGSTEVRTTYITLAVLREHGWWQKVNLFLLQERKEFTVHCFLNPFIYNCSHLLEKTGYIYVQLISIYFPFSCKISLSDNDGWSWNTRIATGGKRALSTRARTVTWATKVKPTIEMVGNERPPKVSYLLIDCFWRMDHASNILNEILIPFISHWLV